ncbi:uncharacterized protein TM35_000331040 [Trypanosoma theileri]|uniref:Uncharacterized protein n=1 Tax=Trypanosoma theileri TaxID=67003 RepID=A0A1X0NLU2_9TRYP|nr:uncharacterized protein TM35_000331040 [Trypanosoma theileri]ORC85647.1 hypothetical protein TM35_000331040 [Trypanosoma theileri]
MRVCHIVLMRCSSDILCAARCRVAPSRNDGRAYSGLSLRCAWRILFRRVVTSWKQSLMWKMLAKGVVEDRRVLVCSLSPFRMGAAKLCSYALPHGQMSKN